VISTSEQVDLACYMLVVLDLEKKIRMKVNTSNYITEGMLLIECEDRR